MTDYDDTEQRDLPTECPNKPWAENIPPVKPNEMSGSCGGQLEPHFISVSPFPYVHADLTLKCEDCGKKYTFGIPAHHPSGMSLYIYQGSGIIETLDHVPDEPPFCPFHNEEMKLTKIFGTEAGKKHDWRYQYKCPKCYLVLHKDKDGSELAPKEL